MSYRSEALQQFDAMTEHEWAWFRPRRLRARDQRPSRDRFRAFIVSGRVDPTQVLHNVDVARRHVALYDAISALSCEYVQVPVAPKGQGSTPRLQVIA